MDKVAFDTTLKAAADRVTADDEQAATRGAPRPRKREVDWSQRLAALHKRRSDPPQTAVTNKLGSLAATLQHHLPRIRPLDSIAGAVTGAGLGYASATGDDTEEGKRKRIKRMLLGALVGAAGGNVVGDRARRYVANMLVPAGYSGLGDSGDGHLRQLVPDSPSQFIDAAIKDKPHPKFSRPLQMASETTGKTFSLPPEHLQARQELMRRAMGLPIADPDNAYFRPTGRSRYVPTETSGGVAGTYDTVGVNPRRWQQLATDPSTAPYLSKLTKRVQTVAGRPEIEGRYPALGDWLSRHGYRRETPGVLNIHDHWDFGLTPRENTTLLRQLVTPWQWQRPSNTYAADIKGGWKSKIDGVFMDNDRIPTNLQHMTSLAKRKLLDGALLRNNGVVFDQDFSTITGRPIF